MAATSTPCRKTMITTICSNIGRATIMKKHILFIAAVAAVMTSCAKEQLVQEEKQNPAETSTSYVYASFAQDTPTKVVMGESDDTKTPLYWNKGDMIAVANLGSLPPTLGYYMTDNSVEDGAATATFFKCDPKTADCDPEQPHVAVYPLMGLSDDDYSFKYSDKQHYSPNTFDKEAMPLVASNTRGNRFTFNAQAAVLRLKVSTETKTDVKVGRIIITSKDKNLTGNAYPNQTFTVFGAPEDKQDGKKKAGKTVVLECQEKTEGNTDEPVFVSNDEPTEFNIVLPPQKYPSGDLTITVHTGKGDIVKTSKTEATFEAGKVYNIEMKNDPKISAAGWCKDLLDNRDAFTKISIQTSASEIPEGALALNPEHTLWEFANGNELQIITKFSHINLENSVLRLFQDFNNVTEITGLDKLITADRIDMGSMFAECNVLTQLDLTSFDTKNVTNMENMFLDCKSLQSIKFGPNFSTAQVKSMGRMFSGCEALLSNGLDVTSFDTGNVEDMQGMFYYCNELTSLDVSKFDTKNVTNMQEMFWGCNALTSLDVAEFNTDKVTSMKAMFENCSKLTSLDVSNFNTANVTDMQNMFRDCQELTSLNVSKFTTSNVTNMSGMFSDCIKLTTLDVSKFTTSNVTDMSGMFNNCEKLTTLDVSKFNTEQVTNMHAMFALCPQLTSLDVSKFNTSNVTSMRVMFENCQKLTSLDVSNFNTANVEDMSFMFCSTGLISLNLSNFNTSKVTMMKGMFDDTSLLESLTLSDNFTLENVKDKTDMFKACAELFYQNKGMCCTVFGVTDSEIKAALRTGTGWDDSRTHIQFALSGTFTVNDNAGTKTAVRFSNGNLWADASSPNNVKFHFENNQYDFRTYAHCGSCINGVYNSADGTDIYHWGLFGWSTNGNGAAEGYKPWGINTSTNEDDYAGIFEDWGKAIDESGWRTLTGEEMEYLFGSNSDRAGRYKYPVMVCGVPCCVIAPDDWDLTTHPLQEEYGTTATGNDLTWEQAEDLGLVCLPAAGIRQEETEAKVNDVGKAGFYWASTIYEKTSKPYMSYFMEINGGTVYSTGATEFNYGRSVRLVKNVSAAK